MLASLLPGIRELRAPLAAGYVWILGLWLGFGHHLPSTAAAHGGWADVYKLATWAGKPVVLAAITFAAYLVGTFSLAATKVLIHAGNIIHRTRLSPVSPGHRRAHLVEREMTNVVISRLSERFAEDQAFRDRVLRHLQALRERAGQDAAHPDHGHLWFPLEEAEPDTLVADAVRDFPGRWNLLDALVKTQRYVYESMQDLRHMGRRLIGREAEVYANLDRLHAEYSFRTGLAGPVVFLSIVLGARLGPLWFIGALAGVVLLYLGVDAATQADLQLVALLSAHRIESTTVDRLMTAEIELRPYEEIYLPPDTSRRRSLVSRIRLRAGAREQGS